MSDTENNGEDLGARRPSLSASRYVGVIDEGSSGVTFSIFSTPDFREIVTYRTELHVITPKDGWFEQDPLEIMNAVYKSSEEVQKLLLAREHSVDELWTIGITNQRESVVVWDPFSGLPLYNAILWNDIRSNTIVDRFLSSLPDHNENYFRDITGLPISAFFSALKLSWLRENVPEIRQAMRDKRCKVGTIDSWIVWNLTKGRRHVTDVTNASRTLLMNLETLNWDPRLLRTFSIPLEVLPEIRSCSEMFGYVKNSRCVLKGLPITGIMANQQAGMLGQLCLKPGQAKASYRLGCFLLCNTGQDLVFSPHGLLTTVAYKLGPEAPVSYALEGAVAVGGHALSWLEKKVRIMPSVDEAEKLAKEVRTTGDVYFVPAFTGLYAPYWRKDARGIICGLTQYTTKHHIVRAALEAICFQCHDILECMYTEAGFAVTRLFVDGVLSSNDLLMQLQADIAGVTVYRSNVVDLTTVGAAMCAAQAKGIELSDFSPDASYLEHFGYQNFLPTVPQNVRTLRYAKWKRAVERSFGWAVQKKSNLLTDERYKLLSSIPVGLFLITSFAFLVHAQSK